MTYCGVLFLVKVVLGRLLLVFFSLVDTTVPLPCSDLPDFLREWCRFSVCPRGERGGGEEDVVAEGVVWRRCGGGRFCAAILKEGKGSAVRCGNFKKLLNSL